MDKRHQRRTRLVQNLFAYSFGRQQDPSLEPILKHLKQIDATIQRYASRYPLDKIAKMDLAILRMSVYEIIFVKQTPIKVAIDEAIILAKEFGTEKSYAFVNGVLGALLKDTVNHSLTDQKSEPEASSR